MNILIIILMILFSINALSAPIGDCSMDPSLANRSDVVMCESWEQQDWWANDFGNSNNPGYSDTSGKKLTAYDLSNTSITKLSNPFDSNSPMVPKPVGHTEIVSRVSPAVPCKSGNCLRVHMNKGTQGYLSTLWELENVDPNNKPESLYFSYYMHLSPNWSNKHCDASGTPLGAENANGGKWPGLGDPRSSPQCGNGGNTSDGKDCWTMRSGFKHCEYISSGLKNACAEQGKPNATTRFYSYIYSYRQAQYGSHSTWDGSSAGDYKGDGGTCADTPNNFSCGNGTHGMLENNKWYHIEMYVDMNNPTSQDPTKADGTIRGWINGQLAYEKTNMIFRIDGHDNLHARTLWLNIYLGGSNVYNCSDYQIHLDQMVVSNTRVGPRDFSQPVNSIVPKPPTSLQAN